MPAEIIQMPPYDIDLLSTRARKSLADRGYPPEQINGTLVYQEVKHQRTLQLREWRDDRLTKRAMAGEGPVRNDQAELSHREASRDRLHSADSEVPLPAEKDDV